ncbi:DoxX family protein [Flavobacterium piscinae]|uniref:DoxX family protein n=1 Tax=Flavobacterium piscinae TaxID=2506424 RepID=A0A4Q1KHP0_9FLAO|nr:DoxX family protein [Flavobacterium piscinae]MBC8882400.1 DoxX family protein [Flavobacterium piscinae]RXR28875.1 DoxX family protein [Flavobacterium piscinae]
MKTKTILSWSLRLTVSIILLQTLYYKFTAHPDSVHIFTALGVEPWGRIGLGVVELITAILILLPKTKTIGMLNSLGIILGAVFSHFLVLGINVSNDGGGLFTLAIIVLLACSLYLFLHFEEVKAILRKLKP